MDWRYKALLQSAFSVLPAGERLNFVFQRYVTKSLPTPATKFAAKVAIAKRHLDQVQRHLQVAVGEATFYEFGAGADLTIPLSFYAFGVQKQVLVDIRRLSGPFLANNTIRRLQHPVGLLTVREPRHLLPDGNSFRRVLKSQYGIDYRAPCDARQTGIPAESIDCITSTNTLEHIPSRDIGLILIECHRLLREGGIVSVQIDYQDHYSYFDQGISAYNFFRYSDRSWRWFNQSLHYQNRLRHSDYLKRLVESGFELIEEHRVDGSAKDSATIDGLLLAPRFRAYELSDLATRSALLILRKRGARSIKPGSTLALARASSS